MKMMTKSQNKEEMEAQMMEKLEWNVIMIISVIQETEKE